MIKWKQSKIVLLPRELTNVSCLKLALLKIKKYKEQRAWNTTQKSPCVLWKAALAYASIPSRMDRVHSHPPRKYHAAYCWGSSRTRAGRSKIHIPALGTVKKLGTDRCWWKWWCHLHLLLILGVGPCPALLPPPLSTEVSITAATTGDQVIPSGGHTERVRWITFALCLLRR